MWFKLFAQSFNNQSGSLSGEKKVIFALSAHCVNIFPGYFYSSLFLGLFFDVHVLTYDCGFAQPLLLSPPPWHDTVLQARGVGAELSRQVAVQAASRTWRGQAGWLAGRCWLVGLVPPHGLRHLGSVSPGGVSRGWEKDKRHTVSERKERYMKFD